MRVCPRANVISCFVSLSRKLRSSFENGNSLFPGFSTISSNFSRAAPRRVSPYTRVLYFPVQDMSRNAHVYTDPGDKRSENELAEPHFLCRRGLAMAKTSANATTRARNQAVLSRHNFRAADERAQNALIQFANIGFALISFFSSPPVIARKHRVRCFIVVLYH